MNICLKEWLGSPKYTIKIPKFIFAFTFEYLRALEQYVTLCRRDISSPRA